MKRAAWRYSARCPRNWLDCRQDPSLEASFALCEQLDVPVGVDTGFAPPGAAYGSQPGTRATLGSLLLLVEALLRHCKLRFYIMHAGYPYLDDTLALLHAHPQVHVDLAGANWMIPREEFHEYLLRLVQAGFAQRLMFGSDNMHWPVAISRAIEAVGSAPLPDGGAEAGHLVQQCGPLPRVQRREDGRHRRER